MLMDQAFLRPGTASTFIPRAGTVNEWRTSAEVTSTCTTELVGTRARFVTSIRWVRPNLGWACVFIGRLYVDVIGIVKSTDLRRLGSSYSQYH